jgi:hypothetical protein
MSIKIITSFPMLMQKAAALGKAKLLRDPEAIQKAQLEHDSYKEMCLKSDEMHLGVRNGDLF